MMEEYGFKPEFSASAPPHQCNCYKSPSSMSYPCNCNANKPLYPLLQPPPPNFVNSPAFPEPPPFVHPSPGPPPPSFENPPPFVHPNPIRPSAYEAYRWVDTHSSHGTVPSTALHGGTDIDGHAIYVGRAFFQGDWIPAKVIPGKNVAYIAYEGEEHAVDNFQVLCEQKFDWVPTQGGQIPFGAVQGGQTSNGEPLYIGRAYHEGSQTVGKVHASHGVCYIPFGGREIAYPDYEILVLRS